MNDPGLMAEEIRQQLAKLHNQRVTRQGVYKELRRLQRASTVFKSRGRFFLSLPWLLDSRTELERVIRTYSSLPVVGDLLPEPHQTLVWKFSDIHAMDRLVVNLLVTMLRNDESRRIYHWEPYPWYAVFHADLAEPFLKEFVRGEFRAYGVLGARSPISTKVVEAQKRFGHTWWIGTPNFPHREDTAISVKPPFILRVKYPPAAVQVFRDLFAHKAPFAAAALSPFHALQSQKVTYRVSLAHLPARSKALATSFGRLFSEE